MIVEGWLDRAARARPDRPALQTPQGAWSYADLLAAARLGADELTQRGAGRGARVAIVLPPGLAFAQALHACFLLGAVAVPLDPRSSQAERALRSDGAAVVLDTPLTSPAAVAAPAGGVSSRRDRRAGGAGGAVEHDLDATAVVLHTSGTTAAPTPVELTYGNLLWSALASAVALGFDPGERWLCALPLAHVGGLSILVRSAVYATTAVVHEGFETDRILHALREQEITLVSLVATTLTRLLDAGLTSPPSLRAALTGGGPVSAALQERARAARVPVLTTYGLTEACSQVTTNPLASIGADLPAAGPPLFCTRVRISPEQEILVQGPTVSSDRIAADGWLHTGDLGSLDDEGRLTVTGRMVDTIITGGENVAPAEIEAVLESHPDVLEAAVVGRPDPRWGEAVTAIVVARPGIVIEGETLRAHCARVLAPYKVPKRVVQVRETLPRTPSGKLLRAVLR